MPTSKREPIAVAIIGAGGRGRMFARLIAESGLARVCAVAEPRDDYRQAIAEAYDLPADRVFRTWQELAEQPRLGEAAVVATMDRDHVGPAVACLDAGYHLLLEKPMAVNLADCQAIADAQTRAGTVTSVCHSMRYHKGFSLLKRIVDSGRLGQLMSIDHLEQVAWWHQAHSFVRGNWGNEGKSSFMLLAKSCHDIDYLAYLVGSPCQAVSSFGSLGYFNRENAPVGSADRCVDCALELDCAYSAIRHYVETNREHWPAAACAFEHSREAHLAAIQSGPYGRCVWKCDNDVVDHQVVNLAFAAGITATFTMTAFTQGGGRLMRVHGTEAEARFAENRIEVREFGSGNTETIEVAPEHGGHGGGDTRVVDCWLRAIVAGDPEAVVTNVHESLRTHRIVFAAETARRERRLVTLD